jgi:hypothetical protein
MNPKTLKSIAFDLHLSIHKPAGTDLNVCAHYDQHQGACLDQDGVIPCPSCATYGRLVEEFQAIPVG